MRLLKVFIFSFSSFFIAGCSNHPLVDDVTYHLSTYDIIHKVRCEAKLAYIDYRNSNGLNSQTTKFKILSKDGQKYGQLFNLVDKALRNTLAKIAAYNKNLDKLTTNTKILIAKYNSLKRQRKLLERRIRATKDDFNRNFLKTQLLIVLQDINQTRGDLDQLKERISIFKKIDQVTIQTNHPLYKELKSKKFDPFKKDKPLEFSLKTYSVALSKLSKKYSTKIKRNNKYLENYKFAANLINSTMVTIFQFKITENNNAISKGNIKWPISVGSISLDWKGTGDEKKRESTRDVKVAIKFSDLLELECGDALLAFQDTKAKRYPITGNIGIDEFMIEYLRTLKTSDFVRVENEAIYQDTLTFTTSIKSGLNPSVELKALKNIEVAGGIDFTNSRTDIHEVTVAISPYK